MVAKNKLIVCIISICILVLASGGNQLDIAITELKIGDYIQFGQYTGQPILWRVIADSANSDAKAGDNISGDPMLFSDKVLCLKAFDAAGDHEDSAGRNEKGSNYWGTSDLRSWLISFSPSGGVVWLDGSPPEAEKVDSNEYANEKGFLADGNFTEYERSLVKPVEQKALLYADDYQMAEGGTTPYKYNDEIAEIINNYEDAYYVNVMDTVFILDPKQIHTVYELFGQYYNNHYENAWLRAPDTNIYTDSSPANVLYIQGSNGVTMYRKANFGEIGVRPALVLDCRLTKIKSGNGTGENPYDIKE
ncbi:MAG: hypothetical protein KJ818_00820 [Candidatus Omnitrophica bacterium]|nr:hypothetical protein [Candidatus Omnitrophota bacterium]